MRLQKYHPISQCYWVISWCYANSAPIQTNATMNQLMLVLHYPNRGSEAYKSIPIHMSVMMNQLMFDKKSVGCLKMDNQEAMCGRFQI